MTYLKRAQITIIEVIIWWAFFSVILFSFVLKLNMLQNVMLAISFVLGVVCLFYMVKGAKDYNKNRTEIKMWGIRFIAFKIVPVLLPIFFS